MYAESETTQTKTDIYYTSSFKLCINPASPRKHAVYFSNKETITMFFKYLLLIRKPTFFPRMRIR